MALSANQNESQSKAMFEMHISRAYFEGIKACKRRDSIRTTLQTDKTDPDIESLKILLKCYLHLLNHLPLDTLKVRYSCHPIVFDRLH